jgi:malate dehydrogenase (quinone)
MLTLLQRCFGDKINSQQWKAKITQMIPSYGLTMADNPELLQETRALTNEVLGLNTIHA